ncbi:MAG: hypothetical protein KDC43_07140 [Saprospiraceae bacterium]|nr:hypothetical protein [Saprospiraceae bacterium]MCB0623682.1 hypothetical protein [Saprospiraceae bacterium]MCB0675253.1 hypothetical protein [Saprospiraceae bacterium]MCB0679837.1 hypothetical protein [Saprospiraceae bacterium]
MMKRCLSLLLLSSLAFFIACQSEPADPWQPLDLLPHGIPVKVLAPDSAKVKTTDYGYGLLDVTVTKMPHYAIQILASDAMTNDLAAVKAEQLAELKKRPEFTQVLKDEDNGFVYELRLDSTRNNYGFRYVRLQGDKEYVFQTGLMGVFTQEDVERMYEAVQDKK